MNGGREMEEKVARIDDLLERIFSDQEMIQRMEEESRELRALTMDDLRESFTV